MECIRDHTSHELQSKHVHTCTCSYLEVTRKHRGGTDVPAAPAMDGPLFRRLKVVSVAKFAHMLQIECFARPGYLA